jgi:hypothetical protein
MLPPSIPISPCTQPITTHAPRPPPPPPQKVTSYSLALREIDTVQDEDEYVPNALEVILRKVRGVQSSRREVWWRDVHARQDSFRSRNRSAAAASRILELTRIISHVTHTQGHLDMLEEPLISTLLRHKWEAFARTQVRTPRPRISSSHPSHRPSVTFAPGVSTPSPKHPHPLSLPPRHRNASPHRPSTPPKFLLHLIGYLLLEVSQTVLIWLISSKKMWNGPERASQEYVGFTLALIMVGAGGARAGGERVRGVRA